MNFLFVAFLCILSGLTNASHFRGGVIQWRPVNATNFDGLVRVTIADRCESIILCPLCIQIEITHRMSWRRSAYYCDQNTINNRQLIGGGYLYCSRGCRWYLGSLSFYCTDYSVAEDWSSGERTWQVNVGKPSNFQA